MQLLPWWLVRKNVKQGPTPLVWTKTADQILATAVRKRSAISESGH